MLSTLGAAGASAGVNARLLAAAAVAVTNEADLEGYLKGDAGKPHLWQNHKACEYVGGRLQATVTNSVEGQQ